jgi:hypothetical protein
MRVARSRRSLASFVRAQTAKRTEKARSRARLGITPSISQFYRLANSWEHCPSTGSIACDDDVRVDVERRTASVKTSKSRPPSRARAVRRPEFRRRDQLGHRQQWWNTLCSYTHTGYQQIGARWTSEGVGSN